MAFCHYASGFLPMCRQMEDISLALYGLMAVHCSLYAVYLSIQVEENCLICLNLLHWAD